MVSTYTALSEPDEPSVVMRYCANCGTAMLRPPETLPDICPTCDNLTTWLEHLPRHILWRNASRKSSSKRESG